MLIKRKTAFLLVIMFFLALLNAYGQADPCDCADNEVPDPVCILAVNSHCPAGDGCCEEADASIPVTNNVYLLVLAGFGFCVYKLVESKKEDAS
jgi:hypothetical protein